LREFLIGFRVHGHIVRYVCAVDAWLPDQLSIELLGFNR